MSNRLFRRAGIGVVGVGVLALIASFVSTVSVGAVDYGTIPGGQAKAQQLDAYCRDRYYAARAGSGNLKTVTNGSAYAGFDWISAGSDTGRTTIDVQAGSTAPIQLRINHLDYICAVALQPATNNLGEIDARMASGSAVDGVDRAPAPSQGYNNSPNRTFYGFGLYGLGVNTGSVSGFTPGAQVVSARSDSTRFWHVSTTFTYTPPQGGFTESQDVTVTARIRNIEQYYYRPGTPNGHKYWEVSCSNGGVTKKWNDTGSPNDSTPSPPSEHSTLPDRWFTDQCGDSYVALTFRVNVPYNYSIDPKVTVDQEMVEAGADLTVRPSVTYGPTGTRPTSWQLSKIVKLPGGAAVPGVKNNNTLPCNYYQGAGISCVTASFASGGAGSGTTTFAVNKSPYSFAVRTAAVVEDYPVGTMICYVLSVNARSHAPGNTPWRHSEPDCAVVAKRPLVHVTGGDLIVGKGKTSDVVTGASRKTVNGQARTYGSWGEYAVAASGSITRMASGAGYSDGQPSNLFCSVSYLTVTNAGTNICSTTTPKGRYAVGAQLPAVETRFTQSTNMGANPVIDVSAQPAGTQVYRATGNVTLRASSVVPAGHSVVIVAPTATVSIEDSIRYASGPYASASTIPQVVIIANTIRVRGTVERVDSWLIASGNEGVINTCSDVTVANKLNALVCSTPLTINGPVAARSLLLYRTAGAGTDGQSDTAAETFNIRPDAYLWALNQDSQSGRLRTVSTEELPPRF